MLRMYKAGTLLWKWFAAITIIIIIIIIIIH